MGISQVVSVLSREHSECDRAEVKGGKLAWVGCGVLVTRLVSFVDGGESDGGANAKTDSSSSFLGVWDRRG